MSVVNSPDDTASFGFCRSPWRSSFTSVNEELTRRVCEFGFCCSPVLPAPRRPLQLAELFAENSDCTRKPIYGLTQQSIPISGSSFYSTPSISTNTRNNSTDK